MHYIEQFAEENKTIFPILNRIYFFAVFQTNKQIRRIQPLISNLTKRNKFNNIAIYLTELKRFYYKNPLH